MTTQVPIPLDPTLMELPADELEPLLDDLLAERAGLRARYDAAVDDDDRAAVLDRAKQGSLTEHQVRMALAMARMAELGAVHAAARQRTIDAAGAVDRTGVPTQEALTMMRAQINNYAGELAELNARYSPDPWARVVEWQRELAETEGDN